MPIHYLDNAATTRTDPAAAAAAMDAMTQHFENPASLHTGGIEAERLLERARAQVADAVGCVPAALTFTSGGTEANNTAIFGAAKRGMRRGRHIISSAAEHPSVLEPLAALARDGFEVTLLSPGEDGRIAPAQLENALRPDTILVCFMLVNNETGAINPVQALRTVLTRKKSTAWFHCDAVQALGKLKIPLAAVDSLAVSGHKVHAPKGIGALYLRPGKTLPPLLYGGGQERGMRSGTPAMPLIAAFGEALHIAKESYTENAAHISALHDRLTDTLACIPGARPLFTEGVPHILSVVLPDCPGEVTLRMLADEGVYVSTGSACARGRRSHVLEACGIRSTDIDCTLRIGLSRMNTTDDIDALCAALQHAALRLRRA